MKKKSPGRAISPNPLDYPGNMSGYERDSLVAEAILAAEKKKAKSPKNATTVGKGKARKSVNSRVPQVRVRPLDANLG